MTLTKILITTNYKPLVVGEIEVSLPITYDCISNRLTCTADSLFTEIGIDTFTAEKILGSLKEGLDYLLISVGDPIVVPPVAILSLTSAIEICRVFPGAKSDLMLLFLNSVVESIKQDKLDASALISMIEMDALVSLEMMTSIFNIKQWNNGICSKEMLITLLKRDKIIRQYKGLKPHRMYDGWTRAMPTEEGPTAIYFTMFGCLQVMRRYLCLSTSEALAVLLSMYPSMNRLISSSLLECRRIESIKQNPFNLEK